MEFGFNKVNETMTQRTKLTVTGKILLKSDGGLQKYRYYKCSIKCSAIKVGLFKIQVLSILIEKERLIIADLRSRCGHYIFIL